MNNKPLTNGGAKLIGEDGNAYFILGTVSQAILKSDKPELVNDFNKEATSGDYNHLLRTCAKYVTIE